MTSKNIVFGREAQAQMLEGATVLAKAVSSTMGPSGHNVIIDTGDGPPYITKDGVTVARSVVLKERLPSMGAELLKEVASKTNELAGDGPQPLFAKVLTPDGWTTMGELKVGDTICGTNGTTQKVLGVFHKGKQDVYRVTLCDGNLPSRSTLCSGEHLWTVLTESGKKKTITTKEIQMELSLKSPKRGHYFIPFSTAGFNKTELPIDPYLLGVLLGDGSLSDKHEVEISVGKHQNHILQALKLPNGTKLRQRVYEEKNYIKAVISGSSRQGVPRGEKSSIIKATLKDLGLLGTRSTTKFIPKQYLFSSIQDRILLLKGLIDTDGHYNVRGRFEYSTTSEKLFFDFVELCRSLAIPVNCQKIKRKRGPGAFNSQDIYRITELKGRRHGMKISSIEKLDTQTEMMCIKVSNEDHLYITDDFIPTHNTTTATVLGFSILEQGVRQIATGRSAISLKKGIDAGVEEVLQYLKTAAIPINNNAQVAQVGTISANGDNSIGQLIADAVDQVGVDGIITIEKARSVNTELEVTNGMKIDSGFISPYFITNGEKNTCVLENPYVLLTTANITTIKDIVPILEKVLNTNRPILIVAENMEGEALHTVIANKMKNVLSVCVVKAPSYGEFRIDVLNDLRALVGGEVIGTGSTTSIQNVSLEQLGEAKQVTVSKSGTIIVGKDENAGSVRDRVETLRNYLKNPSLDDLQIEKARQRLARLSGGVAVIKVGGSTETEINEKKDRVEDAVNATVAAVQEGIVSGGGTALFFAGEHLKSRLKLMKSLDSNRSNDDILAGVEIVINACRAPLKQIVINTGESFEVVANNLSTKQVAMDFSKPFTVDQLRLIKEADKLEGIVGTEKQHIGYNAATGEYEDLFTAGIVDPVKVTRYALEHASSVVGLMLTCNAVISLEEGEE